MSDCVSVAIEPREVVLFAGESYSGVVQRINAAIEGGGFRSVTVMGSGL